MSYQPIILPAHAPPEIISIISGVIDPFLSEFRFLLTVQKLDQESRGSLQRPLLILILTATDGASQLLQPGELRPGDKFKLFLKNNFPWELDQPDGISVDEACQFLWDEVRCPLIHRYSMRNQQKNGLIKFGRIFSTDDESLVKLENLFNQRPYTTPTIRRGDNRTVIWIDSFYWALRIAIQRSVNTVDKTNNILEWLKSGKWDPK